MRKLLLYMFFMITVPIFIVSCTKELEESDLLVINSSSEIRIQEFIFLADENIDLPTDIISLIDEENKTIKVLMPRGTDVSSLKPTIRIPENLIIIPDIDVARDFSELVEYTITALDGTRLVYTIDVDIITLTERQALLAIYTNNPANTLGWDITANDISTWEGVVMVDDKVVELSLDEKGLSILPPEIENLFYLKTLSVARNALTNIPASIGELFNNLEVLYINNNAIDSVPLELFNLIRLEDFRIFSNVFQDIPSEIKNLKELQSFSLSNNLLEELPIEIGELISLTSLQLNNNEIDSLPMEIENLTNLLSLGLSGNPLGEIPESVLSLEQLTVLNIGNVGMTEVSRDIDNLVNLRRLILSNNVLSDIPQEIGKLTQLNELFLNNNSLESIPVDISNLLELQTLDLTENSLVSIPQGICDLENLGTLIEHDPDVQCQ